MKLKGITVGQRCTVPCWVLTRRQRSHISDVMVNMRACEEHWSSRENARSRKIRNLHDCTVTATGLPIGDKPRSGVEIETVLLMERHCTCSECGHEHNVLDAETGGFAKGLVRHRQVVDPKVLIGLDDPDVALRDLLDAQ